MKVLKKQKAFIIFCVILVTVVIVSLAAYQMTGHMGIEERFKTAAGIPHDTGGGEGKTIWSGFSIEGDGFLYAMVLAALGIACVVAYRHFRI